MTIAVLVVVLALVATDHVEIVPPLDVAVGPGRRIREVPLRRARAPPFPEASAGFRAGVHPKSLSLPIR